MKSTISLSILLLSVGLSFADSSWNQFRGPNGSGVDDSQKPPVEINLEKQTRWKVKLPPGASSPIIIGNKIFLTAFDEGKLYTLCLSTADGKLLWKAEAPAKAIEPFHKTEGSPAASTPLSDGKKVISYFGSCGIICYDLNGKELWKYLLPPAETNNNFGSGTSPVLSEGLVLLVRDLMKDSAVYAIDAETGSLSWSKKREGFPTSWTSPIIWDNNGKKELITAGGMRVKAYDVKTGEDTWAVGNLSSVMCASPVVGDKLLFQASWSPGQEDAPLPSFDDLLKGADDDKDGALSKKESEKTFLKDFFESNDLNHDGKITRDEWEGTIAFLKKGQNLAVAIKPGGKGDITKTHVVWKKTKGLPYVPSSIYYRGQLFMVRDGGLASSFEAATGKEHYVQERIGAGGTYYSSPVAANGYIYVISLEGVLTVLKAGPELKVVSTAKLGEVTKATPAIANDTLYIRSANYLWALSDK